MSLARRFATGLSSLRDRAANRRRRLAALRFNPSRVRPFIRRHPALTFTAIIGGVAIVLDRAFELHALAMVLMSILAISVADAWDDETRDRTWPSQ